MRLKEINRQMRLVGLTKAAAAREIGVTWQMVYLVCTGKGQSARVRSAIEGLIAERRQVNAAPPAA